MEMMMTVEETRVQPDSAEIDRRQVRRQLHLVHFETFQPVDGYGTLAKFDVSTAGLLTVKGVKLRKKANGPLRLVTARLERDGGFSVELRKWLREFIFEKALTRLRGKLESDLASLTMRKT